MKGIAAEIARAPLFEGLGQRQLSRIARLIEPADIAAGEVLVREGTHSRRFFVILRGHAAVTVRGRRRATLSPGEFFGELAILNHGARTATVTSLDRMRLATIEARAFQALLAAEPKIALHLLGSLARRLEHLTTRPAGRLA